MAGSKPFSKEEYLEIQRERKRMNEEYIINKNTWTVLYKRLCLTCEKNAQDGKKIIYDCPQCYIGKWRHCSPSQILNGALLQKLQGCRGNIEWMKAYGPDRALKHEWKRHEAKYELDLDGRTWTPKD